MFQVIFEAIDCRTKLYGRVSKFEDYAMAKTFYDHVCATYSTIGGEWSFELRDESQPRGKKRLASFSYMDL